MKNTVIYHRADFDGIFCREIAKRFVKDAELIGWDFGDPALTPPPIGDVYVLDLPVDRVFGFDFRDTTSLVNLFHTAQAMKEFDSRLYWIDHHKSSIESHPTELKGYRIDGVAACRLAWQWFSVIQEAESPAPNLGLRRGLPQKQDFIDRNVPEPLAVRLAGEYDIWDKRDPRAEAFQFGLRSDDLGDPEWSMLLDSKAYEGSQKSDLLDRLLWNGQLLQRYQKGVDASVVKRGFDVEFEGKTFLALNTARCNSLTFESATQPHHDGLMGFYWTGKEWSVSLYHSPHHKEHDLSLIASKYGGGGHRGACGFRIASLPFVK